MIGIGNYVLGDSQERAPGFTAGANLRPTDMPSTNIPSADWAPMDVKRTFGTMTGGAPGIPGWAIGLGVLAVGLVGLFVIKKIRRKR